ncbi:uncharacterized protein LOC135097264 [Scylla paramamosain]|uniref:uncharacterized protein LOC135097264 n=1 Tax=Scylla paramamosain TaxID=85552 RepID=UPI003082964C
MERKRGCRDMYTEAFEMLFLMPVKGAAGASLLLVAMANHTCRRRQALFRCPMAGYVAALIPGEEEAVLATRAAFGEEEAVLATRAAFDRGRRKAKEKSAPSQVKI